MFELIGQSAGATPESPPLALVPLLGAILAFLGGVTLWLAGRHVLRPGFVFIGGFVGAAIGLLGGAALESGLDPLIISLFGLITGGLLGWLMFRTAIALSMGLVLGVAMTVITASTVAFNGEAGEAEDAASSVEEGESDRAAEMAKLLDDWWDSIPEATLEQPPPEPESPLERAQDAAEDLDLLERTGEFAGDLADDIEPIWNRTSASERWLTLGSALIGFGLGLAIGIAAPKRAAGAVTACLGPAIWIPSAAYVLLAIDVGAESVMPQRPLHWLGVWGTAVIIGLAAQWTRKKPNADKG